MIRLLIILLTIFSTNINAQLSDQYSTYEEIIYPKQFGNLDFINIQRKAGQEVVFRFVQKKNSIDKYPSKAMLAMAWLEILYNEMVKYPKAKRDEDVENLFEIRNQMRKSIGLDENASAQNCIDRYMLFSKLLSFGKLEINDLSDGIKARQKVAADIKRQITQLKKSYEENINEANLNNSKTEIETKKELNNVSSDSKVDTEPKYFEKLSDLKKLYESNLISELEYNQRKKKILDENF